MPDLDTLEAPKRQRLHDQVTRELALTVIRSERSSQRTSFPNEDQLCHRLGVSRTVLRESMKVLADKGMVVIRPRTGTRARPRAEWNLLDRDILSWEAQFAPDPQLLRHLCEVRLAIEPTAAGFAAVRATESELDAIEECLRTREEKAAGSDPGVVIDLDLAFHNAIVTASHNPLLVRLSRIIREPFRTALVLTSGSPAAVTLGIEAHRELVQALRSRDPIAARIAADKVVGLAMVAVEEAIKSNTRR